MKVYALPIVIFFPFLLFGQKKEYNTKIDKAKTVNIYGNGKTIIGQIIINPTLQTKVFLTRVMQYPKNSTGLYTTVFEFNNLEKIPLFGIDITLSFDSPIDTATFTMGSAMNLYWELSGDHKNYKLSAGLINKNSFGYAFAIAVRSKTKIKTEIKGIDGKSD